MRDIQMPVGPIREMNVAIREMRVGNSVDLDVRGKDVYDHCVVERDNARTQLFAPDKLAVGRIHGEKITLHPNDRAFVTFHRAGEMTPGVVGKKLSMDNVNVFARINDHMVLELTLALAQI